MNFLVINLPAHFLFIFLIRFITEASESALYSIDTTLLSDRQLPKIFSHSGNCLFTFLMLSSEEQSLLKIILMISFLLFLVLFVLLCHI